MAKTDYVVLYGDTDSWTIYGSFPGSNDKQAISAAIADGLEAAAPYCVAVPLRSWKPRRITVETAPRVKFAGAS